MNPCYEYRVSLAGRMILAANLPTAFLVGYSASYCATGAIRPLLNSLRYHVRVRNGVILVECLLVLGIFAQWWLVGRWLDHRRKQMKPLRWWILPVAVITFCACVMAPTAFGHGGVMELVNICLGIMTLLAWVIFFLMFVALGVKGAISKHRNRLQEPVHTLVR